ncbi:MAG: type II secretion system protein GspE, partial [Deltaproteobacteria bacterium]|nr:type II secretion system protein GspE [Deltaproteobacteria bacterium]
ELLQISPAVSKLVVERADAGTIRNFALTEGLTLLKQDGWQKARDGVTTIEEVLRVTREEA